MRGTAAVPDLADEDAALVVHSLHDRLPCLHFLVCMDAGSVRISVAVVRNGRCLADEQPASRGALRVVEDGVWLRDVVVRAAPCQRRKCNSAQSTVQLHSCSET